MEILHEKQFISEIQKYQYLSLPSNAKLGKKIFDHNEVEINDFSMNRITAFVNAGQKRKVEFVFTPEGLSWNCTCRKNQNKFCKHAVALAYQVLK